MSALALSTRSLDKTFGSLVVAKGIEINLPAGERYALIGPNGAGKTTLINLITGMLRPDAGRILLGDQDVVVSAGTVRLHDGTLAGSAASLLDCLRVLIAQTGCSVEDAVVTATTTPLTMLGLPPREETVEVDL